MLSRENFTSDESFNRALRAWFAGQALAGMLASPHFTDMWTTKEAIDEDDQESVDDCADAAVNIADALIARLEEVPE